jgi:hypothetical protein
MNDTTNVALTNPTIASRVVDLQEYIGGGRILEAMNEFYAENVSMQENTDDPIVGRAKNIEREREFLANVKEFKGYTVVSLSVGPETSAVESVLEFIDVDDKPVRLEQVAIQKWQGDRIVSERFYYDPASK